MNTLSIFLTVIITGIILVIGGLGIALLLAPKSDNHKKENLMSAVFLPEALRGCTLKPAIIFMLFYI
jgi:hypothetical protein